MKNIKVIFPAVAFLLAIGSALATSKRATELTYVLATTESVNNGHPSCIVIGKCEQFGNMVCTDYSDNILYEYLPQYEICATMALGTFQFNE